MLPISYMSNSKITLIRPLYLTEESKIITASKNLPIIKSKCPADKDSKRKEVKDFVHNLIKENPEFKKRIENAILSPKTYNLLDLVDSNF